MKIHLSEPSRKGKLSIIWRPPTAMSAGRNTLISSENLSNDSRYGLLPSLCAINLKITVQRMRHCFIAHTMRLFHVTFNANNGSEANFNFILQTTDLYDTITKPQPLYGYYLMVTFTDRMVNVKGLFFPRLILVLHHSCRW